MVHYAGVERHPPAVPRRWLDDFYLAGEVVEAKVITDKFSGRSKGFGFVTMKDEEMANKAIEAMNGKDIEGRPLTVNVAKPMAPRR